MTAAVIMNIDGQAVIQQGAIADPASAAPPGVGVTSVLGATSTQYARADHTHASSVQR